MLTFAFDASGDENTTYMTVAGFASHINAWDEFTKEWRARLGSDGVEYFRAVDANNFNGPFEHWRGLPERERENKRRALFKDLMDIISRNAFEKFSCTVVNTDYRATDNNLRHEFTESAYSYAARVCESKARYWATTEWKYCQRMELVSIFEAGDGGQDQGKMRERLSKDYGHIPPNFRPKKDTLLENGTIVAGFVPLQAADWLAWETGRAARDVTEGKVTCEKDLRWPMQQFLSRSSPYLSYVSLDDLNRTNQLLKDFDKVLPIADFLTLVKNYNHAKTRK